MNGSSALSIVGEAARVLSGKLCTSCAHTALISAFYDHRIAALFTTTSNSFWSLARILNNSQEISIAKFKNCHSVHID